MMSHIHIEVQTVRMSPHYLYGERRPNGKFSHSHGVSLEETLKLATREAIDVSEGSITCFFPEGAPLPTDAPDAFVRVTAVGMALGLDQHGVLHTKLREEIESWLNKYSGGTNARAIVHIDAAHPRTSGGSW